MPAGRGAEPAPPAVATEPMVRVNEQNKLRTRTYASLLASPYEKDRCSSTTPPAQLAVIDVRTRAVRTDRRAGHDPFAQRLARRRRSSASRCSTSRSRTWLPGVELRPDGERDRRDGRHPGGAVEAPAQRRGRAPMTRRPAPASPAARGAAADTGRRNLQWHPIAGRPAVRADRAGTGPRGTRGLRHRSPTGAAAGAAAARRARRGDRLVHWTPPYDSTQRHACSTRPPTASAARASPTTAAILFVTRDGHRRHHGDRGVPERPDKKYTLLAPSRADRDSAARAAAPRPAVHAAAPAARR